MKPKEKALEHLYKDDINWKDDESYPKEIVSEALDIALKEQKEEDFLEFIDWIERNDGSAIYHRIAKEKIQELLSEMKEK